MNRSRIPTRPSPDRPETAADLRRRALRVRTLMADIGNDLQARQRLAELARDLDSRASALEMAQQDVPRQAAEEPERQ